MARMIITFIGLVLMAAIVGTFSGCGSTPSSGETAPAKASEILPDKEVILEEEVVEEKVAEKKIVVIPVEASAYKLTAEDCADPLPEEVKLGTTLMACDGSIITGTLEIPAIPDPVVCPEEPDLTNLVEGNIKSGVIINEVTGTFTGAVYSNCDDNGQTGCIATATYKSADLSNLDVGNIKSGVSIAGVTGQYPSATYTLPGASATADLTAATFDIQVKSGSVFEYWDESGARHTDTGDLNITASNIKEGVVIFGTEGTIASPEAVNKLDIRAGVTVNGVTGELKTRCRNTARLTSYDASWPPTNTADGGVDNGTVHWYETLSDYESKILFSTTGELPVGFTSDNDCGASNWVINGGAAQYKDKITGITWTGNRPENSWANAVIDCANLGMRLPTQKEVMQAYVHGIAELEGGIFLPTISYRYWTATSATNKAEAFTIAFGLGEVGPSTKTADHFIQTFCVAE